MTIDTLYLDITTLPADLLVLTPNRRLAAWLDRDHDNWQRSRGTRTWGRLNAVPFDQWLQQAFDEISLLMPPSGSGHPRLLSNAQSALLWRQVLEQHWEHPQDIDGLVKLAQQARTLLCRWRWQPCQWQAGDTLEQIEFARWHEAYNQLLNNQHCLDQAELAHWVMEHGAPWRSGLPRNIHLHGFNDPDEPQLRAFVRWLQQDGIQVRLSIMPPKNARCDVITLSEVDDQFAQAIHWALQQRNDATRIGVVIPNLQAQRNKVRALCQHLWSLQMDATAQHWSSVINITAAPALGDYPLTSQLSLWMKGLTSDLPLQHWHLLLTSPYCCASEPEWLQRDAFFEWLQTRNRKALPLSMLKEQWIHHCGDDETSIWLGQLHALQNRSRQPVVRWIQWFRRFMALVLSRRGRSLDSEEFQLQQRLLESVSELQELHDWLGDIDFERFRRECENTLANVQFQPQTETAPIQIMGVLEAAGLAFDRLWVCEMEAVNWPPSLNPNPLLSRSIQRAMNMPGASPERELQYATRLVTGFSTAADRVIFSWGQMQGDTEHTCSALLSTLALPTPQNTTPIASAERIQFERFHQSIDTLPADTQGTPVTDQHAKGGSGIVKSQSLCPFKAFAEYRLNLRAEEELTDGIKAADRGALLHKVMEMIWRALRDSAALADLLQDETKFDAWLNGIIEREMQHFRQQVFLEPSALYELERLRTFSIAKRWLQECDGQRAPFSVEQVEKRRTLQIGGLTLDLAVDRIDRLQNDDYVIVDYKSGDKDHKAWIGERPQEPQLPLYTLLEPDRTKGVLFGVLKPDVLTYKGLVAQRDLFTQGKLNGLKQSEDWQQQMQQWQSTLERLAEEFRQGKADVSPLDGNTCGFCHLAAVCRINEVSHDRD